MTAFILFPLDHLPTCPCCEARPAVAPIDTDHLTILCQAREISTDEGYLCEGCRAELLERYPEETPQEQNTRMGWIPYAEEETRRVVWTADGLYDIDDDQYEDMEICF